MLQNGGFREVGGAGGRMSWRPPVGSRLTGWRKRFTAPGDEPLSRQAAFMVLSMVWNTRVVPYMASPQIKAKG